MEERCDLCSMNGIVSEGKFHFVCEVDGVGREFRVCADHCHIRKVFDGRGYGDPCLEALEAIVREIDEAAAKVAEVSLKFTKYFLANQDRPDRKIIRPEWISRVLANPLRREVQKDGRIRLWGRIEEAEGRALRIILLEDGETVHNAFFDRRFKEENP